MKYVEKLEQLLAEHDKLVDEITGVLVASGVSLPKNNPNTSRTVVVGIAQHKVDEYRKLDREFKR